MNHINVASGYFEKANEFLMDPNMAFPKVQNSWGAELIQNKAESLQHQALSKIMSLKANLGLPQNFRLMLEQQIERLNDLRKRDSSELDRRMKDIRRVQKIISDLEQHRQSYLSHVHMFGDADMTMDLAEREKHRNRLAEWEDEINFRNAMLEQLRLKAKSVLCEMSEAESVLKGIISSQQEFRTLALQELSRFNFSRSVEIKVCESALNEGQIVFLTMDEWEHLTSSLSMTMLKQLEHHFEGVGHMGYQLRSDFRYYSFLEDSWLVGDSDSEGISFTNPPMQLAIKAELLKSHEKANYQKNQFLRRLAEECVSLGRVDAAELKQWLKMSELLGQSYWPSLVVFSTVIKTYQLGQRYCQIDRLMEMAKADGIVRPVESELLKNIEKQLRMPDARPPQLEKVLQRNSSMELLPSREELLDQICQMAMCDDELHANETKCLMDALKDLGLGLNSLDAHLKRQVS